MSRISPGSSDISGVASATYAIGDDLPQNTNRTTMSKTETNNDGLQTAKLHYIPHENGLRVMRYGSERLRDLARPVNAFDVAVTDFYEAGVYQTPA
jgi:hypothetical protein